MQVTTTIKVYSYTNGAVASFRKVIGMKFRYVYLNYQPSSFYDDHIKKIREQEEKLKNRKPIVVPVNREGFHDYWARHALKSFVEKQQIGELEEQL